MTLQIRIATIDDVLHLSYVGKKTFDQSFGHLFRDKNDLSTYLNNTFSIEKIKNSITKSNNFYWILFYNDEVAGYAKIQLNSPSEFIASTRVCKLQKIYIVKDYLSKGIGAQLQELIFDKLIENNQEYVWLSVLKSNKKAISFYEKNTYNIVGEHPFIIGKEHFDFWVMCRKL